MPNSFKRLNTAGSSVSASAVNTVYTCPASTEIQIDHIKVTNRSGATATIRVHHVANGGSVSDSNCIQEETSMADGDTGEICQGTMLSAGDTIRAAGDGTNAVGFSIYGLVMT